MEHGPGDHRVAVSPGREALVVVEDPRPAKGARAGRDTRRSGPGAATVGGGRYHHVGVGTAAEALREQEAECRKVGAPIGVEGDRRPGGRHVGVRRDRVGGPRLTAVERDVRARDRIVSKFLPPELSRTSSMAPVALDEAGMVDGLSCLGAVLRLVLPAARPGRLGGDPRPA
jgi:hypothetical protein